MLNVMTSKEKFFIILLLTLNVFTIIPTFGVLSLNSLNLAPATWGFIAEFAVNVFDFAEAFLAICLINVAFVVVILNNEHKKKLASSNMKKLLYYSVLTISTVVLIFTIMVLASR